MTPAPQPPARHPARPHESSARWFFQFRPLPSATNSTVCATRLSLVSGRLASAIHLTYSRRWLGAKASHAPPALLFFASAASSSAGTFASRFGAFFGRDTVIPSSFSFIACLMNDVSSLLLGR